MTRVPSAAPPKQDELSRVAEDVAVKLRGRGIRVADSDSPADIVAMLEGVEAFEEVVRLAGGDLMMDEPPAGGSAQPDDPRFGLPLRTASESVPKYIERLGRAADVVSDSLD